MFQRGQIWIFLVEGQSCQDKWVKWKFGENRNQVQNVSKYRKINGLDVFGTGWKSSKTQEGKSGFWWKNRGIMIAVDATYTGGCVNQYTDLGLLVDLFDCSMEPRGYKQ